MRRFFLILTSLFLLLFQSCDSTPSLEKMAMKRLHAAIAAELEDKFSYAGDVEILSPEVVYSCDSMCVIVFDAGVTDPESGKQVSLPAKYVLLRDVVMSAAYGHPYYAELISGRLGTKEEELKRLRKEYSKSGQEAYITLCAKANHIDEKLLR